MTRPADGGPPSGLQRHESLDDRFDPAVRIAEYDPGWPAQAAGELRRIGDALGTTAVRLEHVGSTAVPGLAAKPIVDLQVSVAAIEPRERYVEPLERLGYLFVPDPDSPDFHLFAKPAARPRTHHLHVCVAGSDDEVRHVAVRDFLRAHPEEAARYAALKRELVERQPGDRLAYVARKERFLTELEARALGWAGERFVAQRVRLPGGDLRLLQPGDAADLPDDGAAEWAPLVPYWSVLWRSGVALARELAESRLAGLRAVELGCGLGAPSLAAARGGATALATDACPEALELVERNAGENGVAVETMLADWSSPGELIARGPFDLALAADVLYERTGVALLLSLLPRLGREVWVADPGRPAAEAFLEQARRRWSVSTSVRDGIEIHRLRPDR